MYLISYNNVFNTIIITKISRNNSRDKQNPMTDEIIFLNRLSQSYHFDDTLQFLWKSLRDIFRRIENAANARKC